MSVEECKTLAHRITEELWGAGDLTVVDEIIAPDFLSHSPGRSPTIDREGLIQSVIGFHKAFTNIQTKIDDMIVEGNKVAFRGSTRLTHTGESPGAAAGKEVVNNWIVILRIKDGKIAERWIQYSGFD